MLSKYLEELKNVKLFKSMDNEGISKVLRCLEANIKTYQKGSSIYTEDENFNNIGIIVEGEADIIKDHFDGTYSVMTKLKKYDTFGEDIICSGSSYANYSIISNSTTTIIYIDGKKLISDESTDCRYRSQVNLNMLKRIAEYSVYINKRSEYSTIISLKKRVIKFLLDNYRINNKNTFSINMNREQMANYLNGTRPAVSKILTYYRNEKVINFNKNIFTIINEEQLIEDLR